MKKTHIGRGLSVLLLVSICILAFQTSRKADETAKPAQSAHLYLPEKANLMDPEDMVEDGYYLLWDHGSGLMIVQHDRVENGTVYSKYSMKPSQSLFSQNASCTVYEAGDIQPASLLQIAHLLRCILAGIFVP